MAKMIRVAFPRRHLPSSGQAADSLATVRDALSELHGATGTGELMMTTGCTPTLTGSRTWKWPGACQQDRRRAS
jgi:hypothetical protein